jgi:hypothetical protein
MHLEELLTICHSDEQIEHHRCEHCGYIGSTTSTHTTQLPELVSGDFRLLDILKKRRDLLYSFQKSLIYYHTVHTEVYYWGNKNHC